MIDASGVDAIALRGNRLTPAWQQVPRQPHRTQQDSHPGSVRLLADLVEHQGERRPR